ncbi:hypothetical protein [Ornithinimicrobium sp. W1665]|uniref:hypothetical protein n=1 Tax=Ornithinimicrobium sp. W1665 TaxID=3416666 RepID=UPI003D6A9CAD
MAAPGEVYASGASGSLELDITTGFSGVMNTDVDGLLPSTVLPLDVIKDGTTVVDGGDFFEVPAGTKVTRLSTFADEVQAEDIDLYLARLTSRGLVLVDSSGNFDSGEEITVESLEPGTYAAIVDLYSDEASVTAPVHIWNLGDEDEANLTASPASLTVTQGTTVTVTASWDGLLGGERYLGQVNFLEGTTLAGSTLVTVNP